MHRPMPQEVPAVQRYSEEPPTSVPVPSSQQKAPGVGMQDPPPPDVDGGGGDGAIATDVPPLDVEGGGGDGDGGGEAATDVPPPDVSGGYGVRAVCIQRHVGDVAR